MQFGTVYGSNALDPHGVARRAVEEQLGDVQFDTMVGTGLSGALVIPTLAERLGRQWAIVRKEDDGTHSPYRIEGSIGERWVFVDDLIDSGRTFRRVWEEVYKAFRKADYWVRPSHSTQFVGTWLYKHDDWVPAVGELTVGYSELYSEQDYGRVVAPLTDEECMTEQVYANLYSQPF